ncbi:neutral zinc metallopeptidase [Yoonia sediminilitoris]|uniref:Putative neutral zinc metallopeptidase n=1 Tax=Yoonia sediminilitoris TaxID=1286148 RepID=A0A2T6KS41_9RHOB|nr:neutral zinc metallopeptidase [Yoonia sediminilitoris]PUB19372.1 putative neutral zinc metallopeptidase [Yoonia sediminilitoris]RCW99540.1 putative neutral zinc metallopeptidase [Yoonia sediminilitoris]
MVSLAQALCLRCLVKWGAGVLLLLGLTGPSLADDLDRVRTAAVAAFDQMPVIRRVSRITDHCGADETVAPDVAYCTTQNMIFVQRDAASRPETAYFVAHAFGHAVQVRHGVADVALAQITARRSEETKLRTWVESQVDCIAGFVLGRAGMTGTQLTDWFAAPPLTGRHWGRDPLRAGPKVTVDLETRNVWFQTGLAGDLRACAPGEFTSDLLIAALRR